MLRTTVILMVLVINFQLSKPQFISFKDGKIGVNFGGYHAEAGLGGLLTGNAAHGGLSASAGTPFGQRAAAGIGGSTGDNSQGGAYASASAGGNVGASAGLGAVAGGDVGMGAEAHVGSLSSSASGSNDNGFQVSKTVPVVANKYTNDIYRVGGEIDGNVQTNIVQDSHIQRIKPPKKYSRIHGHAHVAQPSNQNGVQQTDYINSESSIVAEKSPAATIKVRKYIENVEIPNSNVVQQQYQQQQQQQQQIDVIETPVQKQKDKNISTLSQPGVIVQPAAGAFVTYRKHLRPWRRIHYRKQVVPVVYEQPQTVTVVEKAIIPQSPPQQVIVTKTVEAAPVVRTNVVTKTKSVSPAVVYQQPPPPSFGYRKTVSVGGGGGVGAGVGAGAGAGAFTGSFNTAGLFDSIFNIPIATLKAVNGLVNNVAGGVSASGSVAVSKSVGAGSY